jgi:AcrR family transcriptional regulator
MRAVPKDPPFEPLARRETTKGALLAAARKLFAEKGFDGVSVKEVAQATGHNAALINYHFGGKEGLYRECMMPLIGAGIASTRRILRCPCGKQDFLTRFSLFVEEFIANTVRDQDLCLILKRDSHTKVVKQLYKEHFVHAFACVYAFLKAGKRARILRRDVDTKLATHIIFGSVFDLIALDRLRADAGDRCFLDDKHRAATVRQFTQFMLAAMLTPEESAA